MRKFSSFLFALLLTALMSISVTEIKAIGVENPARNLSGGIEATLPAAPQTPTSFTITNITPTQVSLSWVDNFGDQDGFQLSYAPINGAFTTISGIGANVRTWTINGLQPNTGYTIRLIATSSGLNSPFTILVPTTPKTAPLAPTNVIVFNPSATTLTVKWTDNSSNEDGFIIFRSLSNNPNSAREIARVGADVTSFIDTGLLPKTTYFYTVQAYNSGGNAYAVNSSGFFLLGMTTWPFPPQPPFSLQLYQASPDLYAGVGFTKVGLYWYDLAGDFDSFKVERSFDNVNWTVIGSGIGASNPTFLDSGLGEGVTVYYRVKATNVGGDSNPSNVVKVTTLKHVAPAEAPFNLTAVQNPTKPDTQVDLNWILGKQDNITNNPVRIQLYRSTVSGTDGFVLVNDNVILFGTYTDKNLTPKTKYWYKVRSQNDYGVSDFSKPAVITTAGPPIAPSNLTAAAGKDALGNSIISLTWGDQSDDEWDYTVERSVGDSLNFVVIATLLPNQQAFVNLPLVEGVTYYYRVRASNSYGASAYTRTVSATSVLTGAPNAPFFLTAKASAIGEVTLTWSDNANNEDKFEVERSTDDKTYAKIGETLKNVLTYVDNKGLTDNTLYYYRVRSVNSLGNSGYATANVTTLKKLAGFLGNGLDETSLVVYPNPTLNSVKITLPTSVANESATIRVVDKNNREVLRKIATPNAAGEINLDLSTMPEGAYTVNIQTETKMVSKRIVKY